MNPRTKTLATAAVVLVAIGMVAYKYWDYVTNPWTRNGMVRAQVIQIAPRVSGPIVKQPIKDNQLVRKGDLLFEIDPRTFQAAFDEARAKVEQTRDDIKALEEQVKAANQAVKQYDAMIDQAKIEITGYQSNLERAKRDFERAEELLPNGSITKQAYDSRKAATEIAEAQLNRAKVHFLEVTAQKEQAVANLARAKANLGAPGEENAKLRAAQAALETARLNLEFTQVNAPVDGYITNLQVKEGDQIVANQAVVALVDIHTFYVDGFFRETFVGRIRPGDQAIVTLMSYPDRALRGRVDSIGWGIAQKDGSPGYKLLPSVSPTFEWIRLAQRIPVRINLVNVPDTVQLRVGTTASVLVRSGTSNDSGSKAIPPVPRALQ